MKSILLVLFAYIVGSIPTGVIVSHWLGSVDPRSTGSGNIGATNVLRTAGKKAGIVTLAGDVAKGAIPVMLSLKLLGSPISVSITAIAVFFGHLYPVFLGFRGGKGVATAAGVFLVISPVALLIALMIFSGVVAWKRYVSLGSITSALSMPLLLLLIKAQPPYVLTSILIALLVLYRHRGNIVRIMEGSENRL